MPRQSQFRVAGTVLSVEDAYVDVNVDGVDEYGNVYVVDSIDASREWTFSAEEVRSLSASNKVIGLNGYSLSDHDMWGIMDMIATTKTAAALPEEINDEVEAGLEHLFVAMAKLA